MSGTFKPLLTLCLLLACGVSGRSQTIVNSLSRNGELTWSGTTTGDVVCVQWAPTIAGPWFSSWDELCSIVVTSQVSRANVPMFYRIVKNTGGAADIATSLTARTATNVNAQAIRFVPPAGDGRSHRAGVMLAGSSSFEPFGSSWEFDYQRSDWGLQIVHPFKAGQCIITIHRTALGLSAPARWLEIGYGDGVTTNLIHTSAYTNFFPLLNGTNYHIKTTVTPTGGVSIFFNGSLVATGALGAVHAIDFTVGAAETFPGQSSFDTRQFTGASFPLKWQKGYTGLIIEPVDTGFNNVYSLKYSPGF